MGFGLICAFALPFGAFEVFYKMGDRLLAINSPLIPFVFVIAFSFLLLTKQE